MALGKEDESMHCVAKCMDADKSQKELQVVVGSTNNVKVKAVVSAFQKVFPQRHVRVTEINVCSGVPNQPDDHKTTKRGA